MISGILVVLGKCPVRIRDNRAICYVVVWRSSRWIDAAADRRREVRLDEAGLTTATDKDGKFSLDSSITRFDTDDVLIVEDADTGPRESTFTSRIRQHGGHTQRGSAATDRDN